MQKSVHSIYYCGVGVGSAGKTERVDCGLTGLAFAGTDKTTFPEPFMVHISCPRTPEHWFIVTFAQLNPVHADA